MYENFTDRARRILVEADWTARLLHHNYLGTEHLLLGVVKVDGEAARILRENIPGFSEETCREHIKREGQQTDENSHRPMTPSTKKALEQSWVIAQQLSHNFVSDQHLLLGLMDIGAGLAQTVLHSFKADFDVLKQAALTSLEARAQAS